MATSTLTLRISEAALALLYAQAVAAHLSPGTYARKLLEAALTAGDEGFGVTFDVIDPDEPDLSAVPWSPEEEATWIRENDPRYQGGEE